MRLKFIEMSSKNEDRSLTSGIPIPQWMRSKTESYGFDPSTLSPPTHEGDFFYMKYPKPQPPPPPPTSPSQLNFNTVIESKEKAFNHKFMPMMQDVPNSKVIKSSGTDHDEGTACGASVVEVAHQMLKESGKPVKQLTRVETEGSLAPPSSSYLKTRRNSKSLPASPMTSPAASPLTKRKTEPNRQLSSRLHGENDLCESDEYLDKKSGSSWILMNFFAARDAENSKEKGGLVAATPNQVAKYKAGTIGKQLAEVSRTTPDALVNPPSSGPPKNSIFKSKPYLRDLNLLTPSSM